jgi:hypothetical protein
MNQTDVTYLKCSIYLNKLLQGIINWKIKSGILDNDVAWVNRISDVCPDLVLNQTRSQSAYMENLFNKTRHISSQKILGICQKDFDDISHLGWKTRSHSPYMGNLYKNAHSKCK